MAPWPINGDAEKLRAEFLKLRKHFVVERHLVPADRAPVRGIKSEHDRPSAEFTQPDDLIRRAFEGEIRGRRPGRQGS